METGWTLPTLVPIHQLKTVDDILDRLQLLMKLLDIYSQLGYDVLSRGENCSAPRRYRAHVSFAGLRVQHGWSQRMHLIARIADRNDISLRNTLEAVAIKTYQR
jgi:hypothetical protein